MTDKNNSKSPKAHNIKVRSSARHLAMVGCILIGVFVYAGWRVQQKRKKQTALPTTASSFTSEQPGDASPLRSLASTGGSNFNPNEVLSDFDNTLPTEPDVTQSPTPPVLHINSTRISDLSDTDKDVLDNLQLPPDVTPTSAPAPVQPTAQIGGNQEKAPVPVPEAADTPAADFYTNSLSLDNVVPQTPAPTAQLQQEQPGMYTVKAGDTLSSIADKIYQDRSKARNIFDNNRALMDSPDQLRIGMTLKLPGNQTVTPTIIHTIRKSDSLPSLAMKYYGTTDKEYINRIREKNPALKYGGFKEGVKLIIPPTDEMIANASQSVATVESTPNTEQYYTVQSGDTLSRIAKKIYRNQGRWRAIYQANRDTMSSPNQLRIGMKLRLPK